MQKSVTVDLSGEGDDERVIHIRDEGEGTLQDNPRGSTHGGKAGGKVEVSTVGAVATVGNGSGAGTDTVETVNGTGTVSLKAMCSEIPFSKTAPCFDQTVSVLQPDLNFLSTANMFVFCLFCFFL